MVLRPDLELTAAEVTNFMQDKIATYKVVHGVVLADAFPKSASGKFLRRLLRDF